MEKFNLDKIYKQYETEYKNIFRYISPADNAERFTEENQTLNFYNAVRSTYPNTFAWFEYPWKPDKTSPPKRFDAIIFSKDEETSKTILFIVEAKCLRSNKKHHAMRKDFLRTIGKDENKKTFTDSIRIHTLCPTEVYTVILADYWNKQNCVVNNNWLEHSKNCDKPKFQDFINLVKENSPSIEKPSWNVISLLESKYHLLTMVAKIKHPQDIFKFDNF